MQEDKQSAGFRTRNEPAKFLAADRREVQGVFLYVRHIELSGGLEAWRELGEFLDVQELFQPYYLFFSPQFPDCPSFPLVSS